jgi:hypothetical protein
MSEEEDADRLEQLLDRVESLRERHERTKLGTPLLGSNEAADRRHSLGERPGMVASIKLAVALDHMLVWAALFVDGRRLLPGYAHLSLMRPAFEASAQVRWLLDASVGPEVRIGRGLGAEIKDYEWRRKFEKAMADGGHVFDPSYRLAQTRIDEVLAEARAATTAVIPLPDTTTLVRELRLFDVATDLMAWQYTSGVLHGQAWASLLGEHEITRPGVTLNIVEHTANLEHALGLTAGAFHSLDRGIAAIEGYTEPLKV